MSKQSESKEKQGFRKECPCCKNCSLFSMKSEQIKCKWSSQTLIKESEYRCSIGNFKVGKSNYCNNHKFKESLILGFTATPKRVNSNQI